MGNIRHLSAVRSGDSPLADVMSNNFNQAVIAINSNALDSNNYGLSNIASNHIANVAIRNAHLVQSAIGSQHIADNAVINADVKYEQENAGVKILRIGDVASNMPANGVGMVRISHTFSQDSFNSYVATISWNEAQDGFNSFTATPLIAGEPVFNITDSSDYGAYHCNLIGLDSVSCQIMMSWTQTEDRVVTCYIQAVGAVSV